MTMPLQIILFEDQEAQKLSGDIQRLGDGSFEVVGRLPPANLNQLDDLIGASDSDVDLFLIDYELDTRRNDGDIASYRGTTLATRLREIMPEVPIVLLTRSDLAIWAEQQRVVSRGSTFDEILYKDTHLQDHPDLMCTTLRSLMRGFSALRARGERTVDSLFDMLELDEGSIEYVRESLPPGANWKVYEAAQWVRRVLLHFPGVVYDSTHAAVALGISEEGFRHPTIEQLLEPAEYTGIFGDIAKRWWRHKLFEIMSASPLNGDVDLGLRERFLTIATNKAGIEMEPALDPEANQLADTVCYIMNIPTRIETSLPYYPDARPKNMDEARVSFKAIRESNLVDEDCLTEAGRDLLADIRSHKL